MERTVRLLLKTWIPGTTDFRDQGLDPTDWVNDNVEMATDGKLGKCLYFNGSNARLSSNTYSLGEKWSWSVWIKDDPDVTGWRIVFILNSNGSDADTQTALWVKADETRLEVCNDAKWVSTVKYIPGQWNHIAQTYDGTTTNVYLNGSRISGFTSPDHLVRTNMTIGGRSTNVDGGHVSANNYYKGYLNDFRIWDNEVLTPLEVKRLSQGLVLHYPLNNNGFGNENLVLNSDTFATGSGASGITPSTTSDGLHQVIAASGNSNWHASWATSTATSLLENAFAEGDPFTISFTIKSENANKTNPPDIYVKSGMGYYSMQGSVTSNWSTVYYSGTWKDANSISFHLGFSGRTGTYLFKNWKVEKGTKPTPWCPNKNDELATKMGMNDGIEYDCSGFGNNGSRGGSGTISYTSDTPKYVVSTQLIGTTVDTTSNTKTGAAYITGPCSLSNITALTVSWWAKIKQYGRGGLLDLTAVTSNFEEGTDYNTCPLSNWDSTFRLWDGTNAFNFFSHIVKDSKWHHYVVTFTSGSGKFYRDGVNIVNSGTMGNTLTNFNGVRTGLGKAGGVYRQINEDVSDLRIYATALSADDILALYNLGGSLDSNGTFHTYEYVEV